MLCVWLGTDRIVIRINGRRIYVKRKEVFGAVVPTQYRSQMPEGNRHGAREIGQSTQHSSCMIPISNPEYGLSIPLPNC